MIKLFTFELWREFSFGKLAKLAIRNIWILHVALVATVLFSALQVIYLRAEQRHLTSELQKLQTNYRNLSVERDQLLLERTAWSSQSRIRQVAVNELKMQLPDAKALVRVRL